MGATSGCRPQSAESRAGLSPRPPCGLCPAQRGKVGRKEEGPGAPRSAPNTGTGAQSDQKARGRGPGAEPGEGRPAFRTRSPRTTVSAERRRGPAARAQTGEASSRRQPREPGGGLAASGPRQTKFELRGCSGRAQEHSRSLRDSSLRIRANHGGSRLPELGTQPRWAQGHLSTPHRPQEENDNVIQCLYHFFV